MDEGRDFGAMSAEFLPDDEQARSEIEAEWERMSERGEVIRPGDAAQAAAFRWNLTYGFEFFSALVRRGLADPDDEEGE